MSELQVYILAGALIVSALLVGGAIFSLRGNGSLGQLASQERGPVLSGKKRKPDWVQPDNKISMVLPSGPVEHNITAAEETVSGSDGADILRGIRKDKK